MKNQKGLACRQAGYAAILIIFVIGMAGILLGISLAQTGFVESIMGRTENASLKAFYAAHAGVEEVFYQIGTGANPIYQAAGTQTFAINTGDGTADVTVTGTTEQKTIESTGTFSSYVRKLEVVIQNTTLSPGFTRAIHAGQGGFELEGNTLITSSIGGIGDVYSNGSILGEKNSCGTSGSKIGGSAWAVNSITRLGGGGNDGVCVNQDAYASRLDYCFVNGTRFSPNPPSGSCTSLNPPSNLATPPAIIPLPNMGIPAIKSYTMSRQIFNGNCTIGVTPGCYTIISGVPTIGDIYINGDLIKPNASNVNFSGPVYVEGNINFGGGAAWTSIGLDSSVNSGISQMIVTKGSIISSSNIRYLTRTDSLGHKMFLLFISDRNPPAGNMCTDPSITLSSNADSVLFYATRGCVLVNANSTFHGAILGEKIHVKNNSTVEYDPSLATAVFGITRSGGWQTISFKEE